MGRKGAKALSDAMFNLTEARTNGDKLKIDLAEAALNDLLDRLHVTRVTRNSDGD